MPIVELSVNTEEVLENIDMLRAAFLNAVAQVQPVFGAFMPYSYYAEYGSWNYGPNLSITNALQNNADWISSRFMEEFMPALERALKRKSVAGLRKELVVIWEDILNDKPRIEAAANARYLTGMHSESIAGYATEAGVEDAIQRGIARNEERAAILSRMRASK